MCQVGTILLDLLPPYPEQSEKWYRSMFLSLFQSISCIPPILASQNPKFVPPKFLQQTLRMAGNLVCHQVDRVAKL